MIQIICYKEGARKPKAHTKPMGIINSLLIKLGYRTSISYATLEDLEKLELMGINTMSEKQEGERVWLIVYDDERPCKSYTNEDIHYYKEFVDLFSSRLKRRLYYEGMLNELTALKTRTEKWS